MMTKKPISIPVKGSIWQGMLGSGKDRVEVEAETDYVILTHLDTERYIRVPRQYLGRLIKILEFEALRPVSRPVTGWRRPAQKAWITVSTGTGRKRRKRIKRSKS
jgi:hypothetical protein